MQSCLIRKKTNPRKRRRRQGRLSQKPAVPEAKKQLAGPRSECTRQNLSCSTAAQCIHDFFLQKECLNTVQFESPYLVSLTAQLALCRESKSKDSKMTSLGNRWKTPTSWVRTKKTTTKKQTDCTTFSLTNPLCIDKVLIQELFWVVSPFKLSSPGYMLHFIVSHPNV